MVEKFEAGKWYDDGGHYPSFKGPAKCLRICGKKGFFGENHEGWWINNYFSEVPEPAPESTDTVLKPYFDIGNFIDESPKPESKADTLDEAIRIRNAAIDAATAQIKALMDYDKAIRVKEVIPADVRESIRIIFTRGER